MHGFRENFEKGNFYAQNYWVCGLRLSLGILNN
jgi:hypothetical protein